MTIAIVNDTHENRQTLTALHARVAAAAPDALVWNGDTCNDFDAKDDPLQIVLNPGADAKVPYVTRCLKDTQGVIVAASDYLKVLPASIDRWMPRRVRSLGTDGFGRSEARKELREFFEVESRYIALATLAELAQNGEIDSKVVAQAMKDFGIDPAKKNPAKD